MTESSSETLLDEYSVLEEMSPDRLRSMSVDAAESLAQVIRSFLVENVNKTGGHLGANLGTVELTIALHKSFRSPETPFIFDIGHQCYTHKILTGRAAGFDRLRQRSGMSGFPSRIESSHDFVENSHSSVGAGWAYGLALGGAERVVLVIGDGALTGGVAYEGLNAIGLAQAPITVIYNDNGRSYDVTQSCLSVGELGYNNADKINNARSFFEALGYAYIGPVDGHSIAEMMKAFKTTPDSVPSVVHVRTAKGRGWSVAEQDDVKRMHDVSVPGVPNKGISWGDLVGRELVRRAYEDRRIHVVTAAMPDTLGLTEFKDKFPAKYHDVGMAEQVAVNVCAGLAMRGMKPVLPIVSTFVTRAIDQLIYDVGLHDLSVLLMVDRAGITGPDGPSHHGLFDIGFLSRIPGAHIFSPRTEADFIDVLDSYFSEKAGGLTVVRYPKGCPTSGRFDWDEHGNRSDANITNMLVGYGPTGNVVREARRILSEEYEWRNIVELCLSRVHPLPETAVKRMSHCERVWIVEDTMVSCGVADEARRELDRIGSCCRVSQIALPDNFVPFGSRDGLLAEYGIDAQHVARTVKIQAFLGQE